jgi:Mg-chelatase subunit ChlD
MNADAVNISVVLDRSGSMASIADDIVVGLNQFLARQRQEDGEARVTVAQFDDQEPFEVLVDAVPVREVTDLPRGAYQPRGTTPLYDAIAAMIARVDARAAGRASAGLDEEDQLLVVVTDGLENASRENTRRSVFDMITGRRQQGWSFLFLGADQDSYASGQSMAVAPRNISNWEKSGDGTAKMWRDVSHSTSEYLKRSRHERRTRNDDVYEEDPNES